MIAKLIPFFIIEWAMKRRDSWFNNLKIDWYDGYDEEGERTYKSKFYNGWSLGNGSFLVVEKSSYIQDKIKRKEKEIQQLKQRLDD